MPVVVHASRMLMRHLGLPPEFSVEARTLGELLRKVDAEHHGFEDSICDETGTLRAYVDVFVNGETLPQDPSVLSSPLKDGDEVYILESVAGGTDRAFIGRDEGESWERMVENLPRICSLSIQAS